MNLGSKVRVYCEGNIFPADGGIKNNRTSVGRTSKETFTVSSAMKSVVFTAVYLVCISTYMHIHIYGVWCNTSGRMTGRNQRNPGCAGLRMGSPRMQRWGGPVSRESVPRRDLLPRRHWPKGARRCRSLFSPPSSCRVTTRVVRGQHRSAGSFVPVTQFGSGPAARKGSANAFCLPHGARLASQLFSEHFSPLFALTFRRISRRHERTFPPAFAAVLRSRYARTVFCFFSPGLRVRGLLTREAGGSSRGAAPPSARAVRDAATLESIPLRRGNEMRDTAKTKALITARTCANDARDRDKGSKQRQIRKASRMFRWQWCLPRKACSKNV